ncbi:MAG: UPF0182 family protein, partial [Longimicrobiales bacterium]|nr:UPF0182 family protein [Longimicrobiales bacterium]
MTDFPGQNRSQDGPQLFDLQNLDLARFDRLVRWGIWALAIVVLWLLVSWGQGFWADWLWFSSVGHEDVLITTTVAEVVLYVVGLLGFLALAVPNLYFAWRATASTPALAEGLSVQDYGFVRKLLGRTAAGLVVVLGLLLASHPAAEWETVLLFLNRVPFGEAEPIFGLDFGFFIFTLPALELVRLWLFSAIAAVALVVGLFYYVTGRIRDDHFSFSGPARTQLVLLGAAIFLVIA